MSGGLLLCLLLCLGGALAQQLGKPLREDGMCGEGNLAADGRVAECDYIPPFTTCCQLNGHCGWDCDHGAYIRSPVFFYFKI